MVVLRMGGSTPAATRTQSPPVRAACLLHWHLRRGAPFSCGCDAVRVGRACAAPQHARRVALRRRRRSAEHDRARRIRFRGTQVKARKLLMDGERLRPVRVSAAQHYHVRDQPDAYAAAVRRNVQRLADAVVSPDYQAQVEGRDHLLDSYFSVLSFGASRFVNDPIAGIVRTPLPAAQLASFFAGYATQVRARWGRRKRAGTRASRHLCAPIRRPGRPLNTARFVAVCVWVAALLTQDTETNQLVMMPGGLYSDFLINGVGFGTVKALSVALLAASKAHCAGISAVVEWQLAGQLATLLGDRWPTGAVTSFLFGPHVATTVLSEVDDFLSGGTDALRLPSSGGKDARALHAVPCAAAARRAAAALVLEPLWRLYCVEKYPQRTGTGAPSRRVCAADFVNATLPTRVLDMALRRLSSRRCVHPLQSEESAVPRGAAARRRRRLRQRAVQPPRERRSHQHR